MSLFLQGFLLGLAYVAPIGMQNMYVINTAVEKRRIRALQVALIVIFFDVTLALACFFGIGIILERSLILNVVILGVGSLAVIYIGYTLIKAKPETTKIDSNQSILKIITMCFALTWLNPQAVIDGTLLLGSFKASLTQADSIAFISGVASASTVWFLTISMLVSSFKSLFSVKVLRAINIICGMILIGFGQKLVVEFFSHIGV